MMILKRLSFWSPTPHTMRAISLSLLLASTIAVCTPLLNAQAAPATKSAAAITLNFSNADIESVARSLATFSKANVVVDPRVKGTITLNSEQAVTADQAWAQFATMLRLQGFAIVQSQGLYKILPEADAKLHGGHVQATTAGASGQIVTQIFALKYEQANNVLPVLRPLISPNNTINVNPGNNSLIVTDYADNLHRIARIIETLDVANASDVEIIPLKHAIATDMAPLITRLLESSTNATPAGGAGVASEFKTTVVAEPRSNALILRAATPARVTLVRSLVEKLDRDTSSNPSGNIHVVYLKNAEATKLANTLRAALGGSSATSVGSSNASTATPTPANSPMSGGLSTAMTTTSSSTSSAAAGSTGGQIQADAATNSLIITAPEPQYRQLRAVIDLLDQRRAQVMVESLIAEVDANKAMQMGIQWQNAVGNKGGTVGVIGTNFNNNITTTQGQGNILSISGQGNAAASALGGGLNIGSFRNINGTYVLGSLATFLQQNGDSNILSTPTLLTLDNEEAKIVVGQNVPFVTGQYTNNNTTNGSVNPFQTIERKDVGLTLRIKPQISETGTVKLTIYQEVSSIDSSSVGSTAGLITNKRSIETNVVVDDGSIIVLGGLLSDTYAGNKSQVPTAGDIPLLGWLFKSESQSRNKSNLMVFLRPVVVRDAAATDALSNDRYMQMMGLQKQHQPSANAVINTGGAAVLPELTPKAKPTPQPTAPEPAPGASDAH